MSTSDRARLALAADATAYDLIATDDAQLSEAARTQSGASSAVNPSAAKASAPIGLWLAKSSPPRSYPGRPIVAMHQSRRRCNRPCRTSTRDSSLLDVAVDRCRAEWAPSRGVGAYGPLRGRHRRFYTSTICDYHLD